MPPPSVHPSPPTLPDAVLCFSVLPHMFFYLLPFSLGVGAKSATLPPLAPFVRFLFCCRFFISISRDAGWRRRSGGLDLLAFRFWVTGIYLEAATRVVAAVAVGAMVCAYVQWCAV